MACAHSGRVLRAYWHHRPAIANYGFAFAITCHLNQSNHTVRDRHHGYTIDYTTDADTHSGVSPGVDTGHLDYY